MIKKLVGLVFFLTMLVSSTVFSQTRDDLLRLGNENYEKENYASAAYFYKKIATGSNSGIEEIVHPYDLKHSNRVKEEKVDSLDSDTTATDSLSVDTVSIQIATVEITEDSSGATNIELGIIDIEMTYIYHKLAESYRLDYNYDHAEIWYEKAVKSPHPEFPNVVFRYGEILMSNEKYEEARDQFSDFITNLSAENDTTNMRDHAKQKMKSCNYSLKNNGNVRGVTVTKLDSVINNGTAVFSASYFGNDEIVAFSSATILQKSTDENESYNIYTTSSAGSSWSSPDKVSAISSPANEATIAMNHKGDRIYFSRWDGTEYAIYASNKFQGKWMEPYKLKEINKEGYRTLDPSISSNGRQLYFSSNMEGGKGGMDIWVCKLDRWGNPTEMENLGDKINTPEDEVSPFIQANGKKLYFSSSGHLGYGGKDIFYSEKHEQYGWMNVKNIGKPFNSSREDSYFVSSSGAKTGFFSSDRESCHECGHGNCLKLYSYKNDPPRFFLDGFVFDADTDMEIPNAKITIKDVKKDSILYEIITDETGYYSLSLEINQIYFIKGQKEGYFGDANSVSTMGLTESKSFMVDLMLTPIPLGEIDIPGIEYDYGKATLRDESKKILDELYDFLVLNNNLEVELRSHTDVRSSHEFNMNLSQARAQSCVDYLVSKGIAMARITPVGFGETTLKVEDAQTEEEHQRNRRTAFYVVGQHFGE